MTTSTALTVINRKTGEVIDIQDAPIERLAQFVTDLQDLQGELADTGSIVNQELLTRLDRRAIWTLRVGDGDRQWEISSLSPTAGTETYSVDDLERELRHLVDRRTIDEEAARAALTRQLIVTVNVPLNADMAELVDELEHSTGKIAGVQVELVKVETVRKVVLAGVKKLAKVPGTGAALGRARRIVPSRTVRKAKVILKTKAS